MDLNRAKALREAYEKEARYFKVYDTYGTKFIYPITPKFYARHESYDFSKADPVVVENIKNFLDKGPKDKHEWPVTESQTYGWFSKLVDMDRSDERFYFPRNYCPITRHDIKIKLDKTMVIPKFTGIQWKF